MRALFITGFMISVVFVVKSSAKICENLDIRNNVTQFEKLKNCTVVAGFLQIVLFEHTTEHDFDKISFPELREITGFLLFYRIKGLRSIGTLFPNLTVIRGLEVFKDYSLIIYDMAHLQDIGLHSLLSIRRGSAIIEKNPVLCYAKTINWKMLTVHQAPAIALNRPIECPEKCSEKCPSNHCWSKDHCQETVNSNCNSECLSGCKGPDNDRCEVCKNLKAGDRCVSNCTSGTYLLSHLAICVTKEYCISQNGSWTTVNGECVSSCPVGFENVAQKEGEIDCQYCGANCPKVCGPIEVESISSAQRLKDCTYINGSLIIRTDFKHLEAELEKNLGMIEEIRGYLKIHRSFSIRSLQFLKKLRIIHGKELENNKYSIVVLENHNLQNLWDWKNFTLKIKQGTFQFHYNHKLCLSEIEELRKISGLHNNYTETDVSPHSNGDKFACSQLNLNIDINMTSAKDVIVTWKSIHNRNTLVGYLLYYIEAPTQNISVYDSDSCGDQGWKTSFVSYNEELETVSQNITHLKPFTQYALYVSNAYTTGRVEQSKVVYFTTLSDDPSVPMDVKAEPADSDSILVTWKSPLNLNGILSHYTILALLQEDDKSFIDLRNYCDYPLQFVTVKPKPIHEKVTVRPFSNETTKCCQDEKKKEYNTITLIQKEDFDAICVDLDKYVNIEDKPSHGCGNYMYHVIQGPTHFDDNNSNISDSMRIGIKKRYEKTSSMKTTSTANLVMEDGVYRVLTMDVPGNKTKYKIRGLKHYSIYVLLLKACNQNRTEKEQCSSVVMVSQRTGRKLGADDINEDGFKISVIDAHSVDIRWPEPEFPNAVIVSYYIEIRNIDTENHKKSISECITRKHHEQANYHTQYSSLRPGNYSVRIKATSLAGDGNYTKFKYFYLEIPSKPNSALHITASVIMILIVITGVAFYFWYRRKHALDNLQLIANVNPDYAGYIEDAWEIDRDNIKLLNELGTGTFGTVYNGIIKDKNIPCAIKTVHERADLHDKMMFLNEATVMKKFNDAHHVVRLLGVVSKGTKPLVVMELMIRGDLKTFLRSTRDSSTSLTCSEMYRMAAEIADGMAYLTAKKFVHRDLAARNCMVSADHTVKIGDFGMTRDIYETDYYRKETRGLLPVRWMSPESLADGVFSAESDVWSYGVVLWEIATLAEQPYQGLANEQVLQFVIAKGILERPLQCPDLLYDIMEACWKWRPCERPQFTDIVEKLESHIGQDFKLVSFYHSREGEEFRMTRRELNRSVAPAYNVAASSHWTKYNDEASCYLSTPNRSAGPSSYHSSNGFMSSYPLSSK